MPAIPMTSGHDVALWVWSWTPHAGEGHFGDNPFFDWVRVLMVVLATVQLCVIGRVLVEGRRRTVPMPSTQKARFVALGLAAFSIAFTEVAVIGTPATPRIVVNVLVLSISLYGVHGQRSKQRALKPVR